METASLIGLVLVVIGTFLGAIMKGVQPVFLFSVPAAFLIVFGGAFGAAFLSNTMPVAGGVMKLIMKAIMPGKTHEPGEAIEQIVGFADRARREGLLSLEEDCQKVEEPFLRKGLQMAIDGTDPEQVREVMETEIHAMKQRHKAGQAMLTQIGVFSPTFGIIGAVFGLIVTLGNLNDPAKLGEGISAAFVATFWGVFLANGMFLPFANKLKALSEEEAHHKQLVVEGVLSIQAGSNPRIVAEMLKSFLPPAQREGIADEERKSA